MLPRIDRNKLALRALDSVKTPEDIEDIHTIFWGITTENSFLKSTMKQPKQNAEIVQWKVYAIHKLCVFLLTESGKIPDYINRILARFIAIEQAELISTAREIVKTIDSEYWGGVHQKKRKQHESSISEQIRAIAG